MGPADWMTPLYNGAPLQLTRTSELYEELSEIAECCETNVIAFPYPAESEWGELLQALLPQSMNMIGSEQWLDQHSERMRGALGMRALLLCRWLESQPDFDAQMRQWRLALWGAQDRIYHILLHNRFPPVWEERSEDCCHPTE